MSFDEKAKVELAKPLNSAFVKPPAPGKFGDYVEGWHVIAEANRIFGFDGWSRETLSNVETNRELLTLKGKSGEYQQWRVGYVAKVRVCAGGVYREGTGFGSGMAKPEALGEAIESAVKESETDAMKRALMTFGNPFGLALYDKTQANVADIPPEPKKTFVEYLASITSAPNMKALGDSWAAINDDKAIPKQDRADLLVSKDARKAELSNPGYVAPNFDNMGEAQ